MKPLTRFSWELEVLKNGPTNSTTRLVLLVVGSHARRPGSVECFPSTRKLAEETQLSERSVIDHINAAVSKGWLGKRYGRTAGMRRHGCIYTLRRPNPALKATGTPDGDGVINLSFTESGSVDSTPSTTESSSVDGAVDKPTDNPPGFQKEPIRPLNDEIAFAEPDSSRPLNLTASTYKLEEEVIKKPLEVTGNGLSFSFGKSEGKSAMRERPSQDGGLEHWARALGISQAVGESDRDYKIRLGVEYAKSVEPARRHG